MNMDTIIDADSKSVNALFQTDVQYQVPLYQRRYIWDNENWEVLWKDILDQASKEVSEKAKHFTGPIVTRRVKRQEMRFEVIDGQQRLMTFQLIFCVIRDLCKNSGYCKLKGVAGDHIRNGDIAITGFLDRDPEKELPDPTYKFWASKYDESTFLKIKDEENYGENIHLAYDKNDKALKPDRVNEARSKVFFNDEKVSLNILDAYDYFYEKIRNHIKRGFEEENHADGFEEETKKKIHNLLDVIKLNFELVQITPGESQQAEEIFESVNATGRKLSEFDYLRNNLFLRADDKSDEFYKDYWIFEEDPNYDWKDDKLESLFRAFLIAKLGPDSLKDNAKLFDVYHENLKEENVENEFRELKKYAKTYKDLDSDNLAAPFKDQMQFYKDLITYYEENKDDYDSGIRLQHVHKITRVQALILHLVHEVGISGEDIEKVFKILESYTARRLLVDTAIGTYAHARINDYFRALNQDKKFTIEHLVDFLKTRNKGPWISDSEVKRRFRQSGNREQGAGAYFQNSLLFTERYIFYRIENWMRKNIGESPVCFKDFPIAQERMLHSGVLSKSAWASLGNATFRTGSNRGQISSFDEEKQLLRESGNDLILNQEILSHRSQKWNQNAVQNREEKLLGRFFQIWPDDETILSKKNPKCPSDLIFSPSPNLIFSPLPKPPQWVSMIQLPGVIVSYQRQKLWESEKVLFDDDSLFVCSLDAWRNLQPFIKTVNDARRKQLQQRVEQLHIEDKLLKSAREEQAIVSLVTRDGHLLEGTIEDTYDDVICMEIREHRVIVFRTGLLEFATDTLYEGVVEDWEPDDFFGFIKCQSVPDRIEVKSEDFLDHQSIVSRKLLPNVKVIFNLNIVQENERLRFQALEVEPIRIGDLHRGTIKSFKQEEGSGIIMLNDCKEEIYVNKSQVPPEDLFWLKKGQKVEFNIVETVEGENSAAINVKVVK